METMNPKLSLVVLLALLAVLVACKTAAVPSPTAASSPTAKSAETSAQNAPWQQSWDKLLKDARAEGTINLWVGGSGREGIRANMAKVFNDKFGVETQWETGSGSDVVVKLKAQRNAGLYNADILMLGLNTYYTSDLKPITDPMEPLLILPEVKDPSKFFAGKLPWGDPDTHVLAFGMGPTSIPVINTNLVKKGDISSIRDFVNPKWKEKIVYSDSRTGGPGVYWYRMVLKYAFPTEEEGRAYFRELAKNALVPTRDYRLMTEGIAREKYAIGLGMTMDSPLTFIENGAPIELLDTPEPRRVSNNWAVINTFKNRPHPAATQLFINWVLSKEGLTEISRIAMMGTTRVDIPAPPGLHPLLMPRKGDYVSDAAESQETEKYMKMYTEDFAALYK